MVGGNLRRYAFLILRFNLIRQVATRLTFFCDFLGNHSSAFLRHIKKTQAQQSYISGSDDIESREERIKERSRKILTDNRTSSVNFDMAKILMELS